MVYTEVAAKAAVRNRSGKRVFYLGQDDQLTPAARDFLSREKIEVLPADMARPQRYQRIDGGYLEEKPEHMTHLNGEVLVSKTHPRIAFRGQMDTLQSEILLCQLYVEQALGQKLGQILQLARLVIRCDVLQQSLEEETLCGLDQQEQRRRSHQPQVYYGQPHFMPEAADGAAVVYLNRCRCAARTAERLALAAFSDREGNPTRLDILRALNRMSSMLYILMIEEKAKGRKQ